MLIERMNMQLKYHGITSSLQVSDTKMLSQHSKQPAEDPILKIEKIGKKSFEPIVMTTDNLNQTK